MSKNWYMCTLHNSKVGYQIIFLVLQNKYFFANFYVCLTLQVTTGPNSARAISADRAQAEIRPNLV